MLKGKSKILTTILSAFLLLSLVVGVSFAWFASLNNSNVGLTASIQRNYFESGDGSQEYPFEIRRSIQLYYFSWLQNMGYFNREDESNTGNMKQVYFYLSDDIDMSGFTIPSIGNAEYPFVGNFDGRGHVISNLAINNDHTQFTNEPGTADYESNADQIIGFFGVIGSLDGTSTVNGYTYSKQINKVKDFCLNSVIITSETPKDDETLIGIVAGYVNAELTGVAICNSGIFVRSGLSSLGNPLYENISNYTTIGDCADEYKGLIQVVQVSLSNIIEHSTDFTEGQGGTGGSGSTGEVQDGVPGNAWGGTINMADLYDRLYDIYENKAVTNYSYYSSETKYEYLDDPSLNRTTNTDQGENISAGFTSSLGMNYLFSDFAFYDENYDEGVYTFSKGLLGNSDYIYLMGEIDNDFASNSLTNKYILVHTLEKKQKTGIYIRSDSNYLTISVSDGTPSIVNKTNASEASVWFISSTGLLYTQVNSVNYCLSYSSQLIQIGAPSLTVVSTESNDIKTWEHSGNNVGTTILNYRSSIFSSAKDTTLYIRYQNGWILSEPNTNNMVITDGNSNYLTVTGSGDSLSIINVNQKSNATNWVYNANDKTLSTTYGGSTYYLINNAGTMQAIRSDALTTSMNSAWTKTSNSTENSIKSTIGSVIYSIEYHNGWMLWHGTNYKIHYGNYYIKVTNELTIQKVDGAGSATIWNITNGLSGGVISAVINGNIYYLAVTGATNSASLSISSSVQTLWTTETPNFNSYFEGISAGEALSFYTTYGGVKYYLFCEGGVWSAVKGTDNRFVIGYKYSMKSGGNNKQAIWLSHNKNGGSDDNFTSSSSLETTVIFTWESSGYISTKAGSGNEVVRLGIYSSRIYSVHTETRTRFYMICSISNDRFKCTYTNFFGNSDTKYLTCTGSRFGYGHTYDAILSRPPMSLDLVSGQDINLVLNDGNMSIDSTNTTIYEDVEGSPVATTKTNTSKLNGTYIPITTISDENYIASQRNTGYIVGGANYAKYGDVSSYRLGDVRVSKYELSNLNSTYFDTTITSETENPILRVLTSNASGSSAIYDMANGSTYFNKSLVKMNDILRGQLLNVSDASTAYMYGIHFMDAAISSSRTMNAEKTIIEHTTYYDYELPESSINFNLVQGGYINFFAGTYATDTIVGDNNSFFSLYQVFREMDKLADDAIVAVFTPNDGVSPYVYKTRDDKYYYYNASGQLKWESNIDNIFGTGKSLDDLYMQITSNVYMDKTNTSNTLYYTLRNDVRTNYYYTYSAATDTFNLVYMQSGLPSNYVCATEITDIKQIKKLYSRYTSLGASPLATQEMIYYYSDGTYSDGSNLISGWELNFDDSVTYNGIKYSLVFDLNWIDSQQTLTTDALYYFEIPIKAGEYCLGSVTGGKGAYLLYLDLSTNAGQGNVGSVLSEIAIVQSTTTVIETYEYVKGISVIEDADDFSELLESGELKDYETIEVEIPVSALNSSNVNLTISRSGDVLTLSNNIGTVTYAGYGLLLHNNSTGVDTAFNDVTTVTPIKTTVLTEEVTAMKRITLGSDGVSKEVTVVENVTSSSSVIYQNRKISIAYDSILRLTSFGIISSMPSMSTQDTPVIGVTVRYWPNDYFEVEELQVTVTNNNDTNISVKNMYIASDPSYIFEGTHTMLVEGSEQQVTNPSIHYDISITPSTLNTLYAEVVIEPTE